MDRLVSVIGPAPSEFTPENFVKKLRLERERVVTEIQNFRTQRTSPKSRKRKPKIDPEIAAMAKEYNMTFSEIAEIIRRAKANGTG